MTEIFTAKYTLLWTFAMAAALYLPVRRLIWVFYVRRAEKDGEERSDEERLSLKKRAGMTALLLCFVFSYFYVAHLFRGP